jgi:hypothetical protein
MPLQELSRSCGVSSGERTAGPPGNTEAKAPASKSEAVLRVAMNNAVLNTTGTTGSVWPKAVLKQRSASSVARPGSEGLPTSGSTVLKKPRAASVARYVATTSTMKRCNLRYTPGPAENAGREIRGRTLKRKHGAHMTITSEARPPSSRPPQQRHHHISWAG